MNREEYIDKYVGNINIGDKVKLIESTDNYKKPIICTVKDIFHGYSINFTLACIDADGRRFEYYNASLSSIELLKEV